MPGACYPRVCHISILSCHLRMQIRVHEKAMDKYDTPDRKEDGVIAESNVIDVIRCRVICSSGDHFVKLLKLLSKGFEHKLPQFGFGRLEIVRLKNKFAADDIDPTHFRFGSPSLL